MKLHETAHIGFVAMARFYGFAVVVCLAVWAMTSNAPFWPKWVILGVLIKLGITARLVYGRSR